MVNFFSNASLRLKLAGPILVLLGIMFVVSWFYFTGQAQEFLEKRVPGEGRILADVACAQLTELLNSKDTDAIHAYVESLGGTQDVKYVVVTDEGGVIGSSNLEEARQLGYD